MNTRSGIFAGLVANRPLLTILVLAFGCVALAVVGARNGVPADASKLILFMGAALVILAVPSIFYSVLPRLTLYRYGALIVFIGLCAGVIYGIDRNVFAEWGPSSDVTSFVYLTGFLGLYFFALSPVIGRTPGVFAGLGAILGGSAAGGYLVMEGLLSTEIGAAVLTFAVAAGVMVGAGVNAEHAKAFSLGRRRRDAAATAAHEALAPTAFAILVALILFSVQSYIGNFGLVDTRLLTGVFVSTVLTTLIGLLVCAGALSAISITDQVAFDENMRGRRFTKQWRGVRTVLPAPTAFAITGIAGDFGVLSLFEAPLAPALPLAAFFIAVWVAAGLVFVSIRTSLLVVVLLLLGNLGALLLYRWTGVTAPMILEVLVALGLSALALGQLTIGWRNAGEHWRDARDIAQHAMSDGMQRYLATLGFGAATLYCSAFSGLWSGGASAGTFFIIVASLTLFLAPAFMTALSARYQHF